MDKRPSSVPAAGSPSKVPRQTDEALPSTSSAAAFLTFLCHLCGIGFSAVENLTRHIKCQHGDNTFICDVCSKTFPRKDNLTRHRKSHTAHTCVTCDETFTRKVDLTRHRKSHVVKPVKSTSIPLADVGDPQTSTDPRNPPSDTCPPAGCATALNGSYERYRVDGTEEDVDLPTFLRAQPHANLIRDALRRKKGVKFFVSTNVTMVRPQNWITRGDPESRHYFTSRCMRVLEGTHIEELLETAYDIITETMSQYLKEGSGWVVGHINFIDLVISTYRPLKGSSYIPLPEKISHTRGIVNVKNEDNKCFLWAVLSALHPVPQAPNRLYHYIPHENSLKTEGITFPMSPTDIPKFEKQNGLAINLFGYRDEEVFPIQISEKTTPSINLLLISNGTNQHYCWIKDFNKLMHSNTKCDGRAYYCLYCLHRFSSERVLDQHAESCRQHGPQKIRLPEGDERFMAFKHHGHSLAVPYTIYADFESIIVPMEEQVGTKTERTAEHRPASACFVIIGPDGQLVEPPFLYRGEDCVEVFLEQLKEKEKKVELLKKESKPMNVSDEEEANFQAATTCHICSQPLGNTIPHRDHDHLTGEYRGAAHPGCNLNYKQRNFIPVVLHNLRGYDSHLIMQQIGQHKDSKIDCLANNFEKYISFTFRSLRYNS